MSDQLFKTESKPVTDADLLRLGAELADVDIRIKTLEEEKSDASRAYRVKIRELKERAQSLARQRKDGIVEVKFAVVEVPDDARQMVAIHRADTNELVDHRPMNEAEKAAAAKRRQPEMFDLDADLRHDTDPAPPPAGARRAKSGIPSKSARASSGRFTKKNGNGAK